MLTTRRKVADEIRMNTSLIRQRCAVINHEAEDMVRGHLDGYASSYIYEKVDSIKDIADRIAELNALMARKK